MNSILNRKLPLRVKLTFSAGFLAKEFIMIANAYFLLFFYTDVVGIPAAAAGTIMLIARLWDAINDPMMGILVDKTRSKHGRSRFYLRYFSVPAAVIIALSYYCPALDTPGKVAWVAVTYTLQGMAITIVVVPLNALMARLTDNRAERVRLGQFNSVAVIIANVSIPALTLPIVTFFGSENMLKGFTITLGIYSAVFALLLLTACLGTKGYDKDTSTGVFETGDDTFANKLKQANDKSSEKASAFQLLLLCLKNKYAMVVSISYFFYMVYASVMSSTVVYYFRYNLQNPGLLAQYSSITMVGSVIGILTMGFFHKRFGNSMTCIITALILIVGCLIRLFSKDSIPAFYIAMIILGFGSLIMGSFIFQCIMDASSYGRIKYKAENQAVVMSVFTFMQKFGSAIGGVIAAWLLAAVSYVPNQEVQESNVLKLFFAENIILPMAFSVILIIIFLYVGKLEKELKKLKEEEQLGEVKA
jgi:GPH family glycoside/pentoside/hexuronide:cation symporter